MSALSRTLRFFFAAFLLGQAGGLYTQTADVKSRVPQEVLERLGRGDPQDVIVQFDSRAAREEAALLRERKRMVHDDDEVLAARSRRYRESKDRVFTRLHAARMELRKDYPQLPMAKVRVRDREALQALEDDPEVEAIFPDLEEQLFLMQSLPLIRQPQALAAGFAGAGVSVAVLDTGVDYTRPEFGSCAAPGVPSGCRVIAALDTAPDDGMLDDNGHGTNVAGIVAGVAPQAKLISIDVFTGTGAFVSDVLEGIDWVLTNRSRYSIVAVNLSLGSGRYFSLSTTNPYYAPFTSLRSAGIVPVAASGNSGYSDSLSRPAAVVGAVSVGAVYDANIGSVSYPSVPCTDTATAADRVTCFSNSASFLTLLAPGAAICAAGSCYFGTSQAAPHAAGAAAVLRGAFPAESVDQIVGRLERGPQIMDPRNGVTKTRLDGGMAVIHAARPDFNGDRKSDLLWRNAVTGENYIYPMDGTTILGTEGYLRTVADLNWKVAGIGDFDGNGKADVLWRNAATGENYIYLMNGLTIASEGYIRTVTSQLWKVVGVGDFNGDGKADILWRNAVTGENYLYPMNGLAILGTEGFLRTVADLSWKIVGVGDFDGDGKADILWRNSSTGEDYLYPMNGTTIRATEGYLRTVADLSWQVAGVGDFNGDGKSDILWRNSTTGENYLYPMDGLTIKATEGYLRTVADTSWQIVGVGDFDGDGKSDILWRNSSSGQNYLYPMDGTTIKPTEGYIRTVADQHWQVQNPK